MRYDAHVQPLELEGFGETRDYRIAATAKAFRNLMDGLYSRKIEAVIREIFTNAFDSHVEAGTPNRQFLVTLPREMKLMFSVRDYGVGMDHEFIMDRYSTLYDSSKDHSDEFVGMLGLGSKSPFAYTDGFTLRCWDGQTRRTYASYLGAGGVPLITHADTSPSDEERGVEVSFPVKATDIEEFTRTTERVLKGFATLPLGISREMTNRLDPDVRSSGDRWAVVHDSWFRGHGSSSVKVYALQGCVIYPIESDILEEEKVAEKIFRYSNVNIVLDFDIGELDFTPGRETLSMVEKTTANIKRRWADFKREVGEGFSEIFAGCTTNWERMLAYRAHELKNGKLADLFRFSEYYAVLHAIDAKIEHVLPRDMWQKKSDPQNFPFSSVDRAGRRSQTRTRRGYREFPRKAVSDNGKPICFVHADDRTKNPWKRLSHFLEVNDFGFALVFDDDMEINWSDFGHPPIVPLSTLPSQPRPKRERSSEPRPQYKVYEPKEGMRSASWIAVEKEDDDRLKGRKFLFSYKNRIVKPDPNLTVVHWEYVGSMQQAERQNNLDLAMGGKGIAIVCMMGAQKLHRYRKLPVYAKTVENLVSELSANDARALINMQNLDRFNGTYYTEALTEYEKRVQRERTGGAFSNRGIPEKRLPRRKMPPDNPLTELKRFQTRVSRIPKKEMTRLTAAREYLRAEHQAALAERGLAMGLEVLPETDSRRSRFPYDLLPLRWENLARMLANDHSSPACYRTLVNDIEELEKRP